MDGILILDKAPGMTSHDVVYKARKALQEKRIGHTGTLDPMATGVLVLCVGRATKLVKYFMEHDKRYEADVILGYSTDTLDAEGTVLSRPGCSFLSPSVLDSALNSFVGKQLQIPPMYSAVKIEGKKLYEYARKEQEVPEIVPRPVEAFSIERRGEVGFSDGLAHFSFSLHCGKGYYVRSLVRDVGEKLGIPATLSGLRRTTVGGFTLSQSVSLDQLSPKTLLLDPFSHLSLASVTLPDAMIQKVQNGVFLSTEWFPSTEDTLVRDETGKVIAIYTYDERIDKMRLSVMW